MLENPYATPASLQNSETQPLGLSQDDGSYYRDGKFLIVKDGASLPSSCVITNEPVLQGGRRKPVSIAWTPPWICVIVVLGLLFALIAILAFQKKAKITYSLSERAWNKIVKRRAIGSALLLGGIGLIVIGFNAPSDATYTLAALLGGFLAILISLVVFVLAHPIKVTKFKKGWFRIKGCSPEFLETLPEIGHSPFA